MTKTFNDAEIVGVRFYLRGKPYVMTIDTTLLFIYPDYGEYLAFAGPSPDGTVFWAPLLEKAWAKLKGNYAAADGGLVTSGIRSLTGAPVFSWMLT